MPSEQQACKTFQLNPKRQGGSRKSPLSTFEYAYRNFIFCCLPFTSAKKQSTSSVRLKVPKYLSWRGSSMCLSCAGPVSLVHWTMTSTWMWAIRCGLQLSESPYALGHKPRFLWGCWGDGVLGWEPPFGAVKNIDTRKPAILRGPSFETEP